MLVTILKLPVSTPQAIVGAVIGAGLAIPLVSGVQAQVQLGELLTIIIGWVVVPFAAALFAFMLFTALKRGLRRVENLMTLNRVLSALVVVAFALTAYSQGANDVGAAMGVLSSFVGGGGYSIYLLGLFGVVGMLIGAVLSRGRVLTTIGTGITRLDPQTAFAAQVGAALSVWVCIQFGIPVSITQALVGGIVGVGLTSGIAAVNRRKLTQVGAVWILIPPLACLLSMLLSALALSI
jgi:PiT family inorganic phosphate transporter